MRSDYHGGNVVWKMTVDYVFAGKAELVMQVSVEGLNSRLTS